MKASRQFQKQSASSATPISQTSKRLQTRPFRDPNASTTVQPSQSSLPVPDYDPSGRPAWWDRLTFNPQRPSTVQTKLTVGAPNDQYEQEADRVADQVMSMPDTATQPSVQLEVIEDVQTKPSLQLSADGSLQTDSSLESQLNSSKGTGSPLSSEVRSFMEPRIGADFSQVRVYTGGEAVQMNQNLNAQAFTHKQDIYFGAGKTPGNNALTAHELTHVVQQTGNIQAKGNVEGLIQREEVVDLGETTIYSNETEGQDLKAVAPNAQELAKRIEEMGGPCYDASKMSYEEILAKYNEFLNPGMKVIPASPTAVGPTSPEQMIEEREIRYLDNIGGVPRVQYKTVKGTKKELDQLENEELQKIAKSQLDGVLEGAGGLGGRVPRPGLSFTDPQDTRSLRPPYEVEPPK